MKNEILLFEPVSLPCSVIEFFTEIHHLYYIYDSVVPTLVLLPPSFLTSLASKRESTSRENKIIQTLESNLAFGTCFQTWIYFGFSLKIQNWLPLYNLHTHGLDPQTDSEIFPNFLKFCRETLLLKETDICWDSLCPNNTYLLKKIG